MNLNNDGEEYLSGTVMTTNLNYAKSGSGNVVLGVCVRLDNGKDQWVPVTLKEEFMERNLPVLERIFGRKFKEGTPSEVLKATKETGCKETRVRCRFPPGTDQVYINGPNNIRMYDNRDRNKPDTSKDVPF